MSKYTGTDTVQPDGSQQVVVGGRFTGGTGAYRGAKGTYKFTGAVPSGSTVLTGHSSGSITYSVPQESCAPLQAARRL